MVLRRVGTTTALVMAVGFSKTIQTSNKNFILDVGMEKEQKHKNWDGGYLYYPFLHSTVYCVLAGTLTFY